MKRTFKATAIISLALVILAGCAAPAKANPYRGSINGKVYTGDYAELTFTAPEGWGVVSGAQMNNYLLFSNVPYDMIATPQAGGAVVAVCYEDLTATGKTDCTEESYLDSVKEGMNKDAKNNYEFSDYTDAKVGAYSFKVLSFGNKDSDNAYYIYIRRKGDCMICITVLIPKDVDIDSIIANFS